MSNYLERMIQIRDNPKLIAILGALFVLAISILLWWQASRWYAARLLTEKRVEIREDVSLRGNALSAAVNRRFALVDGLHAFVRAESVGGDAISHFDTFAAELYTSTPGIRSIALAPGGVVELIYPLEGNEAVIGYNPAEDARPNVSADVERAIESGEIILSGPVELIQGGIGLIARQAVFLEGSYWGLVNIVFDLPPILSRADLDSQSNDFQYALRDSFGDILWGKKSIFESDPVVDRIELPETFWDLAAVPQGGWDRAIRRELFIFQTAALIIVALITTLTYLTINHQSRLTLAVEARTSEIAQSKLLLESRVEERTKELSALLEVAQTVGSTLEVKPLLGLIISQLKLVIDYSGAAIATIEGDDLVILDYQGPEPREQILGLRLPLDQPSRYQEVFKSHETVIYADLWHKTLRTMEADLDGRDASVHFRYARSWMGVPLIVKGNIIGILRIDHVEPDRFSEQDAKLVQAFANQAAVAIENARLYEQAQILASLRERHRLARDLHDSVSQALYGISLGAQTARTLLERYPDNPTALQEPLDYLISLSDAALTEMRALIFELRPETLEKEGLVEVLTKQAKAIQTRHNLEVSTSFIEEPMLPLEIKEALYRVVQEAVNNTIKHARATELGINMKMDGDWLVFEIWDNGRGFNSEVEYPGHYGLISMRERLEYYGGRLEIISEPGQSTLIRAILPV